MKKFLVLLFLFFGFSANAQSLVVCNFNDDNAVNTDDAAILIAWRTENSFFIKTGTPVTIANVEKRASDMMGKTISVARLPDPVKDRLSDQNTGIQIDDIAYLLAFITENSFAIKTGTSVVFNSVATRASNIISLSYSLSKLPGTPIGDSSFSTTITGIQTD